MPDTSDRELVLSRLYAAPRDLVWKVWNDPAHISHWWGPTGFKTTIHSKDFRVGGNYRFTMHAPPPDNTNYPNKITYTTIEAPSLLAYDHFAGDEPTPHFKARVTFAEEGPGHTRVTLHSIFPSPEARKAVAPYAIPGGQQTLSRLADLLPTIGIEPSPSLESRSFVGSRIVSAPRPHDRQTWTDPHHIVQWWGPNGFTSTTQTMNVSPKGNWRYTMHGPDGRDYLNQLSYLEVVPLQRIVFQHGGEGQEGGVSHITTVTFTDEPEGKTRIHMDMLCISPEEKSRLIRDYGAEQGMVQTLDRMTAHIAETSADDRPFIIRRTFKAPRTLVWKAWTEVGRRQQWFGPKGLSMTYANDDFRPGGTFHYCLKTPEGHTMWGKWFYREITAPQRLAYINCFSNEAGEITAPPFNPPWPKEMLTVATFTELEGQTTISLRWTALNPTETEQQTFDSSHPSMTTGWSGTFDQLAAYLAKQ